MANVACSTQVRCLLFTSVYVCVRLCTAAPIYTYEMHVLHHVLHLNTALYLRSIMVQVCPPATQALTLPYCRAARVLHGCPLPHRPCNGLDSGRRTGRGTPPIATPSQEVRVALKPSRDTPVDLKVHAFVGARSNSVQYHVFELEQRLPKFAMYALAPAGMVQEVRGHNRGTIRHA